MFLPKECIMALLIISAFGLQITQKQTFAHFWYQKLPENLKKISFISLASRGRQILINIIVEQGSRYFRDLRRPRYSRNCKVALRNSRVLGGPSCSKNSKDSKKLKRFKKIPKRFKKIPKRFKKNPKESK